MTSEQEITLSYQSSGNSDTNEDILTLCSRLRSQVEYYFSAQNLASDVYLQTVLLNNNGRVPTALIANFPKIQLLHRRFAASHDCVKLLDEALAASHVVLVDGDHLVPVCRSLPSNVLVSVNDQSLITSSCSTEARNGVSPSDSLSSSSTHDEGDWTHKELCMIKTANNNTVSTCSPTSFSSETIPALSSSGTILESSKDKSAENSDIDHVTCLQNLTIDQGSPDHVVNRTEQGNYKVSSSAPSTCIAQSTADPSYHPQSNGVPVPLQSVMTSYPPVSHYYPLYAYPQYYYYPRNYQASNPLFNASNSHAELTPWLGSHLGPIPVAKEMGPDQFQYHNYYYNYHDPFHQALPVQPIPGYTSNQHHYQQLLVNAQQMPVSIHSADSQSKASVQRPGDVIVSSDDALSAPSQLPVGGDTLVNDSQRLQKDNPEKGKLLNAHTTTQADSRLQTRGKRSSSNRRNNRKNDRNFAAISNTGEAGLKNFKSGGRSTKINLNENFAKEHPAGKKKRNKKNASQNDARKNRNQPIPPKTSAMFSDENFPALVPGNGHKLIGCNASSDFEASISSMNISTPKKIGYAEALLKHRSKQNGIDYTRNTEISELEEPLQTPPPVRPFERI